MNPEDFQNSSAGAPTRTTQGYWTFIPAALPPDISWSPKLVSALSKADRSLADLAAVVGTSQSSHNVVRPFIFREALSSSRLGGWHTSLEELYVYHAAQRSFWKTSSGVHEVLNYVRALDYGLSQLNMAPVNLRLIREIHKVIFEGVYDVQQSPGEFRRTQNWIGPPGSSLQDALFVPPPAIEMNSGLSNIEGFILTTPDLPELIRLGLIHYQFETIHPFLDGNGRVGRLMIILMMCARGMLPAPALDLSTYFETNQVEYNYRQLAVSQRGDWEEWLHFFLEGIHTQSRKAVVRLSRLQDLRSRYHNQVEGDRAAERLIQVVDLLFARPIITIRQVEKEIQASDFKIAQRYVKKLEAVGILREITGCARNRVYRADEIISQIEGPLKGTMWGNYP
jgi:Fic family protein